MPLAELRDILPGPTREAGAADLEEAAPDVEPEPWMNHPGLLDDLSDSPAPKRKRRAPSPGSSGGEGGSASGSGDEGSSKSENDVRDLEDLWRKRHELDAVRPDLVDAFTWQVRGGSWTKHTKKLLLMPSGHMPGEVCRKSSASPTVWRSHQIILCGSSPKKNASSCAIFGSTR